ncbi:DUF397 domain-containing protein [Streptomyces sp. ME02-6979-3A]|uniref:DUF397 domain-containing protein n=1 Tax=Streptomyces silvae TaxID=2803812 RepID=A0ABU8A1R2_9ACTN|nr:MULTISPECIES: DUF397 domain-containing protein [unclassified Streptomyces]MDX3328032.1 DUF397 domain-containing protein [Streptomyces sp. ME02-6979-3A]
MIRRASTQNVSELTWVKSSYSSDGNEGDCVEVAIATSMVYVRDSKNLPGPRARFGATAWADFVAYTAGS